MTPHPCSASDGGGFGCARRPRPFRSSFSLPLPFLVVVFALPRVSHKKTRGRDEVPPCPLGSAVCGRGLAPRPLPARSFASAAVRVALPPHRRKHPHPHPHPKKRRRRRSERRGGIPLTPPPPLLRWWRLPFPPLGMAAVAPRARKEGRSDVERRRGTTRSHCRSPPPPPHRLHGRWKGRTTLPAGPVPSPAAPPALSRGVERGWICVTPDAVAGRVGWADGAV